VGQETRLRIGNRFTAGLRGLHIRSMRDETLDAPLELGARQQHAAITCQAANPNISANAHNAPGIAPTWVRFAHLHNIIDS
jgi:hypothetical protein